MICELATHGGMIKKADGLARLDITFNSDDFLWNLVEPEESRPRIRGPQI